jgi:hypothetical protein
MEQPAAAGRGRHPWRALAVAAVIVAVTLVVLVRISAPARPSNEYRPAAVDLVASIGQAGASWDVGLESGAHASLTASVRDILRPVSGAPLSPRIGDLMLTDSVTSPSWVAFSSGGGGAAGTACYAINQEAVIDGDRILFRSGLSVPVGSWRREPMPSPGVTIAGACLDRQGNAVERILGPA